MKVFFDTSTLIKKYIDESASENVLELFLQAEEVILSPVSKIEFVSALTRLQNTQFIDDELFEIAYSEFLEDSQDFTYIPFDSSLELNVIEYIKKYKLRTLDGIQLASAKISGANQFVTSDKKLYEAAIIELKLKSVFL